MGSEIDWQVAYETNNQPEACIIQGYLQSEGINCVLKSDESLIYAGGLAPTLANYQIWVPDSQLKDAQKLIQEKKNQKA